MLKRGVATCVCSCSDSYQVVGHAVLYCAVSKKIVVQGTKQIVLFNDTLKTFLFTVIRRRT